MEAAVEGALQEREGVGGDPDGLLRGEMTKNPNLCWEIGWFCISEIARMQVLALVVAVAVALAVAAVVEREIHSMPDTGKSNINSNNKDDDAGYIFQSGKGAGNNGDGKATPWTGSPTYPWWWKTSRRRPKTTRRTTTKATKSTTKRPGGNASGTTRAFGNNSSSGSGRITRPEGVTTTGENATGSALNETVVQAKTTTTTGTTFTSTVESSTERGAAKSNDSTEAAAASGAASSGSTSMAVSESTVTDEGNNSSDANAAKGTSVTTELVTPTVTPPEAPTVTPPEASTEAPTVTPTETPDTKEGSNNGKRSTSGGSKQEEDDTETERAPNATPTKTSATEEEFKRRATTETIADSRSTRTPLHTKTPGERTTAREVSGGKEDGATKTPANGSDSGKMGGNGGGGPTATFSDSDYVTGGPPDGMKTKKYTTEDSESEYGDDRTAITNHSRPGDTSESTGSIKGQDDKDTSAAENHDPTINKRSPTPDRATMTPKGTAGTTKDPKQPNTVATQDLKQSSSKTANYPEKQTAGPDQSPEYQGELNSKYDDAKALGDDKHSDAGNNPPTTENAPNDGMGEKGGTAATAAVATDTSHTNADPADNDYTTTNTKTDINSDEGNPTGSSAGAKSAGNNPPTTENAPNDGMGENGGTAATAAVATDTSHTNADPADNDYTTTNTKTDINSDEGNPTGSSAGAKSAGNNPPTTENAPNDGMGKNGGTAAMAAVATDTSNTNADPADNDYTTTNTKTDTNSDKGNPTGSSAGAKSAGAKSTGVDGDDGSNDVPRCNSTSGRRCIFPYQFNMAVSSNFLLKAEIPSRKQFSI